MIYRLLFILLFTISTNAQIVSVGVDISNAIQGSNVNVPALDIKASIASITNNREIGFELEYFKEIEYFSYGIFANKVIPIKRISLVAGIELVQIIRGKFTSFGYGFNGEVRYYLTDKIGVGYQYNIRRRTDLQLLYYDGRFVKSGFINLIYKWK